MIQRHWRSYRAKKAMIGSRNKKQILVESDYLLKESSEKRSEHS